MQIKMWFDHSDYEQGPAPGRGDGSAVLRKNEGFERLRLTGLQIFAAPSVEESDLLERRA